MTLKLYAIPDNHTSIYLVLYLVLKANTIFNVANVGLAVGLTIFFIIIIIIIFGVPIGIYIR